MLDLVENRRETEAVQERVGVELGPGDQVGIFQQRVGRRWQQVPKQSGLAGAPRAGQDHRREMVAGFKQLGVEEA